MKVGLISDTHGFLDPQVPKLFRGVDHIFHAGDIGPDLIIAQLEAVAPVTAVLGNNDNSPSFPLTQTRTIGAWKFLVHHIVDPRTLTDELCARIKQEQPHFTIFGHTHKQFDASVDGVRFLNPGYAGKPKFGAPRSVAILHLKKTKTGIEFFGL